MLLELLIFNKFLLKSTVLLTFSSSLLAGTFFNFTCPYTRFILPYPSSYFLFSWCNGPFLFFLSLFWSTNFFIILAGLSDFSGKPINKSGSSIDFYTNSIPSSSGSAFIFISISILVLIKSIKVNPSILYNYFFSFSNI